MRQGKIEHMDTCLPDYFGGYHKPYLNVPVDGSTTRAELTESIIDEYNMTYDHLSYEDAWPESEEQLKKSIETELFKEGITENDIIFPDLEPRTEDNEDDCCDSVMAHFCWSWEDK